MVAGCGIGYYLCALCCGWVCGCGWFYLVLMFWIVATRGCS